MFRNCKTVFIKLIYVYENIVNRSRKFSLIFQKKRKYFVINVQIYSIRRTTSHH